MRVEELVGDAARLLKDLGAVFGVGEVAEVSALIEESFRLPVDDDTDRIILAREPIGERPVAGRRSLGVPGDGVAAAPVAVGLGARRQRQVQDFASVVFGAADTSEVPVRAEVGGAQARIRLEATAGERHGSGFDQSPPRLSPTDHARDAILSLRQLDDGAAVTNFDPGGAGCFTMPFHQPNSAANSPNRQVAPELNAVTDTVRLARVEQLPTTSLGAHPSDCIE